MCPKMNEALLPAGKYSVKVVSVSDNDKLELEGGFIILKAYRDAQAGRWVFHVLVREEGV